MENKQIEAIEDTIGELNKVVEVMRNDCKLSAIPLKKVVAKLRSVLAQLSEPEVPEYKDFKLFNKYKIEHADGTPVHGKAYFVLRLDSDKPEERARVSAAMNAYLGKSKDKSIEVLDRVHDWLGVVIRDGKCGDFCSVCLGASDLADDVWEVLHPEASNQKALPDDQTGRDAVPDAPTVTDAIPDAAPDTPAEADFVPRKCPETGGECKMKEQEAPAAKEEPKPMDQLEKRVLDIVAEQLCVERGRVTLDSDFNNDLGADSLDSVELVMAFEEEFGFAIPEEDAANVHTPRQAAEYLRAKGY